MQPWNTARATIYGVAIGLAAAAVKLVAPWSEPHGGAIAIMQEFVGAGLAFGLLCGIACCIAQFRSATADLGDGTVTNSCAAPVAIMKSEVAERAATQDLRNSSDGLATLAAIPRASIPLSMNDAARISASLIFGSSDRRILYSSTSISLNLRATFKMSDTV